MQSRFEHVFVVGCKTVGQVISKCSPSEDVVYTAGDGSLWEVSQRHPQRCGMMLLVGRGWLTSMIKDSSYFSEGIMYQRVK